LTDASDAIVRGSVSTVSVEEYGDTYWTVVEVEVSEIWKGSTELNALTVMVPGGFYGPRGTIVERVPRFSEGEEVILFVEELESGIISPVGLELGKYTVRIDPESGKEMVVKFAPPLTVPYDHRFIPDPPPSERVLLESFKSRVTARILAGWDGVPIPGKNTAKLEAVYGKKARAK